MTPENEKSAKRSRIGTLIVLVIVLVVVSKFYSPAPSDTVQTTSHISASRPDYEHDIEERCKDWIYQRNLAYKLGRSGDQAGAEKARRAMNQFYNDLRKIYSEQKIADTIARIEASGYRAGF